MIEVWSQISKLSLNFQIKMEVITSFTTEQICGILLDEPKFSGENGHLHLLPKLFSKILHIWN